MTSSPTVAVRGEATLVVEPELATLAITVQAHGGDQRSTLDLLARRSQAVADVVSRAGAAVERSETSQLHVYAELDPKRTEKVRRYVGRTTTTLVVSDFSVLSDLIAGAGSVELTSVAGPWWRLREDSPVYRQARLAAAKDALTRARDYASAFGAELVGLVELADEGMSSSGEDGAIPMMAQAKLARFGGAAAEESITLDLEPARQRVGGQVEARFTLSQPNLASVVPGTDSEES